MSVLDRSRIPPAGPPPRVTLPHIERRSLASGLTLLVVEKRELPVVDVALVTRSGAHADPPALAGRAHLAADLLDAGTETRSALQIAEEADLLGATLHARATWDDTEVGLHVLTPRLGPALELLIDVALHPAYADEEVERKRKERLAAILQEQDEPRVVASNEFARVVYGAAHPFGAPIGGTAGSVRALDRTELVRFRAARQRPRNAYMVVVGDVDADEVVRAIEPMLADWQDTDVPADEVPAQGPPAPTTIHVVDRPGAPQSELRVGHSGPSRGAPDYFPLLVLNTIFGGAFTSRLNSRLREEKGFTYGAGSSFAFRRHGGPFVASSAVFTGASAEAVGIVLHEMQRIREERVSEDELERAKSYLSLGLPRRLETTADVLRIVSEQELHGLGDRYYDEYVERVRAVSAADVLDAAQRRFDPAHAAVVVAGDHGAIAKPLEALGVGAVVRKPWPTDTDSNRTAS